MFSPNHQFLQNSKETYFAIKMYFNIFQFITFIVINYSKYYPAFIFHEYLFLHNLWKFQGTIQCWNSISIFLSWSLVSRKKKSTELSKIEQIISFIWGSLGTTRLNTTAVLPLSTQVLEFRIYTILTQTLSHKWGSYNWDN